MKKTTKLQLPIYDTPASDVFKLIDWNTANTNLESAYNEQNENYKKALDLSATNANLELVDARQGKANLKENIQDIKSQLAESASDLNSRSINVIYPPKPLQPMQNVAGFDNAVNFDAILDYAKSNGVKEIIFPDGVYQTTKAHNIPSLTLKGGNRVVIQYIGTASDPRLPSFNANNLLGVFTLVENNVTIDNFTFDLKVGQNYYLNIEPIKAKGLSNIIIKNCTLLNSQFAGLHLWSCTDVLLENISASYCARAYSYAAIYMYQCKRVNASNIFITNSHSKGYLAFDCEDVNTSNLFINGMTNPPEFAGEVGLGYHVERGKNVNLTNFVVKNCKEQPVKISNYATNVNISNGTFDNNFAGVDPLWFTLQGSQFVSFNNVTFYATSEKDSNIVMQAITDSIDSTQVELKNIKFTNCRFYNTKLTWLKLSAIWSNYLNNLRFEDCYFENVYLSNASGVAKGILFNNCKFNYNTTSFPLTVVFNISGITDFTFKNNEVTGSFPSNSNLNLINKSDWVASVIDVSKNKFRVELNSSLGYIANVVNSGTNKDQFLEFKNNDCRYVTANHGVFSKNIEAEILNNSFHNVGIGWLVDYFDTVTVHKTAFNTLMNVSSIRFLNCKVVHANNVVPTAATTINTNATLVGTNVTY